MNAESHGWILLVGMIAAIGIAVVLAARHAEDSKSGPPPIETQETQLLRSIRRYLRALFWIPLLAGLLWLLTWALSCNQTHI